jgi:DNA-binding MarR family transcriptional regulator
VAGGPIGDLFQSHGLSWKQYGVLRSIRRKGPEGATVNDVRRQMTDLRADVTRLIDRLERDGLVERRHDSADQRVVRVFLTEAGEKVLRDIDEPLLEIHRQQFRAFSADEVAVLTELLKRMR